MNETLFLNEYFIRVNEILREITQNETHHLLAGAEMIATAVAAKNRAYILGCTHSAILAEDVFYRAGAPAFWQPLWGPGMSIAQTPGFLTTAVEHNEKMGEDIVNCSQIGKDDVLVVISTSGKNAAPVAVADAALRKGASVIAICSGNYKNYAGNHSAFMNLHAIPGILLIDNHVPLGDVSCMVCGDTPMGPLSTIAGSFIIHTLSALTVEKLRSKGITAPVFMSSNAPGGKEKNEELLGRKEIMNRFMLP